MSARPKWDLSSPNSLDAAAEWLRDGAGGLLVLVVRGEDVAFAVDPDIAPKDALTMVEAAMPEIGAKLEQQRQAAKDKAAKKLRKAVFDANVQAAGVTA